MYSIIATYDSNSHNFSIQAFDRHGKELQVDESAQRVNSYVGTSWNKLNLAAAFTMRPKIIVTNKSPECLESELIATINGKMRARID